VSTIEYHIDMSAVIYCNVTILMRETLTLGFGKGFRKKDAKVRACATYLSNLASARPILNIPVHAFEKYLESNWEIELQDIPRNSSIYFY
jgi:hypothetical protein